jgi:hypothetical protein
MNPNNRALLNFFLSVILFFGIAKRTINGVKQNDKNLKEEDITGVTPFSNIGFTLSNDDNGHNEITITIISMIATKNNI